MQLEGGQVVAILLVVVCSLWYPGLGWSTEKCVQGEFINLLRVLLCMDMVVMEKILRICISRSTHNTHSY